MEEKIKSIEREVKSINLKRILKETKSAKIFK